VIRQKGHSLEYIRFEGKPANRPKNLQHSLTWAGAQSVPPIHSEEDQKASNDFAAWVLESAGLCSEAYRATPIHRRLASCVRSLKAGSIAEAHRLMVQHPHLRAKAIDSLLIGVTEFSRDLSVFETLRKIISRDTAFRRKPLRIWSAGCSNGAELYSMAMLLAEEGLLAGSTLIGTDCRAGAIREAEAGLYPEANVRSVDVLLRRKYMSNAGDRWQVMRSLRSQVQWQVGNLLEGCEKGPWDIVLWRNMAIYLRHEYALKVWYAMIRELQIGAIVVVGKAERPPRTTGLQCISPCIYHLQQSM
jgi:chemotaxis protein methyltransferase CheR